MKHTIEEIPEAVVPDSVVRKAIDCLDSSTDYRECLPSRSGQALLADGKSTR